MRLVDWLDDLCVRFIVNLPHEELQSVERICFQIEEAQWFYEDFIRPLDPTLPSLNLRRFALLMFQHCPLSSSYSDLHHTQAYEDFLAYKTRVPVRGAIMLNHDMTHAVLVKGWKKGAKWSFPRGKINKDEPDLDCAVREVYEETGYDLKEANLVGPEETMKKIAVNMREQNMVLYVFRSVPMDTYFAPRTRKEISKIDWYKLTDLPTLKRKNQAQQGTGNDLIKENNFYMVAPFLGPLKGWIKQQHKFDKQKTKSGPHLAAPLVATGVTDTEDIEVDVGETTADEGPLANMQPSNENFAELVARLGRGGRSSDALPEVSIHQSSQILDPAEELKRLLSVGSGFPLQTPPVEAPGPSQTPHGNPLLAMLQANNRIPDPLPRTPFEQIMSLPQEPQSPHAIPPAANLPPPKLNAHTLGLLNAFMMNEKPAASPPEEPSILAPISQPTPRMQQPIALHPAHESFASPQSVRSAHPYAPTPPPFISPPQQANFQPVQPKPRNAHQDSLLTLFRSPSVPAAPTPPPKSPAELSAQPKTPGYINAKPAPRETISPRPDISNKSNFLEVSGLQAGKPHLTSATVSGPVNAPDFETVKKNTHPSGANGHLHSRGPSPAGRNSVEQKMFVPQQILRREDSLAVGPADAAEARRSRSPRAKAHPPPPQTTAFQPQILRRPQPTASPAPTSAPAPAKARVPTPVLLPQPRALLDLFTSSTPPPVAPTPPTTFAKAPVSQQSFDRRETLPSDQKSALLSLFGKPSGGGVSSVPSPIPPRRSPLPPTPKNQMSGIISPVSPLPDKTSQANSPANLASRSRISSIGDSMLPSVLVPKSLLPTSHPSATTTLTTGHVFEGGYASAGSVSINAGADGKGKSPVDKTFLLGFLEDVARRGR
ncbi:hypothetical protein K504DRAFT_386754 [Pleomassaria siparia CBS 279.74]|uniref:Nudix hydrolase domain-containing protein n=1 Tax=Pleomassaria siparia CBS 279.74 TaxID=1314801 RepID=A0A6G1K0P4_9PLEO|nr:hypothetical protein K504DRAFT_386754 [Pleomassaria siparia CBS 279.74]